MSSRLVKDIAFAFESQDLRSFLDKETLQVTQFPVGENFIMDEEDEEADPELKQIEDNPNRYICIEPLESRESFRIMECFAGGQPDGFFKEQLFFALNSRHPFGRFKDVLHSNEELRQQWFKYKDEWYEKKAVEWLEENGINYKKTNA